MSHILHKELSQFSQVIENYFIVDDEERNYRELEAWWNHQINHFHTADCWAVHSHYDEHACVLKNLYGECTYAFEHN